MILRLALRNLKGAGIRTWLNAIALSFAFVAIILGQGLLKGMNRQAENASVAYEVGGGQYRHESYDPDDPLSLGTAHAELPYELRTLVEQGRAVPILVMPGSLVPEARFMPILIKGIPPHQSVLALPTQALAETSTELPALVGTRLAQAAGLEKGDRFILQVSDQQGRLSDWPARVVAVMQASVSSVDIGQVWVPLERLQQLVGLPGQVTLVTLARGVRARPKSVGWIYRSPDFLLQDLRQMVRAKSVGQSVVFVVLFLLAMLAIFDTQVLAVWRRKREIGMLIAMGMTRAQVVVLFTLEGALHSVLAVLVGAVYGAPLVYSLNRNGLAIPGGDRWGYALGETMQPAFTSGLILSTVALVLIGTGLVAWLPARKIALLRPTEALSGRPG
ncbi:MAG: FtsX-like permease family protein [candidate division WOR-3 bacterium]